MMRLLFFMFMVTGLSASSNLTQEVSELLHNAYAPCDAKCKELTPISKLGMAYLQLLENDMTGSSIERAGRCASFQGCALSKLAPYDANMRMIGTDWPPFGLTMVGHARLRTIHAAIRSVLADNVPGDFAELGVWRGGACIFARAVLNVHIEQMKSDRKETTASRKVLIFDAFEKIGSYNTKERMDFLSVKESDVRNSFEKFGLADNIAMYKGLFEDSLPQFKANNPTQQIAVLRIDGNFYYSYEDAFYNVYEMVPVGGIVIFDDYYKFPGIQKFWKVFSSEYNLKETLQRTDKDSCWFRKLADVKLDPKKRHCHKSKCKGE